ncbi:C3 and PZP-like alpha-2-macroglobulin domain-containing protein 8 [Heptranchias perlo]|uniref:C3 and PZP-like alpha-2-macroglobulin domain-containing protein 8 n=1 Tax=Heptranchias perlo TaxID=212740 RepID=UPI003559AB3A
MRQISRCWWILSNFVCYCCLSSCSQPRQGYLVAAPSVFRAGVDGVISVTIFNPLKETEVHVQLVAKGETVAQNQASILEKGTVTLKVPPGFSGQAQLKVWGNRQLTDDGYIFHNFTTVTIDSKGSSVFIQTDKPVYKPKQKVLITVFTVTPDLRPTNQKLEVYIVDPRGSRMIQWNDLQPVCCGIVNMSFPLSDQPVFGEWLIFIDLQGHTYNKTFEVQKYVLPKFELTIEPPKYIKDLNRCEEGTVRARYTFGKPVLGRLTVNMTVNGVGYYRHELGHPVVKTMEIDGSATFPICAKEMMPVDVPEHFRGSVNIWASVAGVDGSKQITFDDTTPVHKQLIDIKYSKDTRKQFKPGLPYNGKVEVTYPDGSPADGITVRIKAELTPKDNVYTSELVSEDSRVLFEIPSIPTAAQYVWLETKVTAINGTPAGDQYLPSYLSISSWYSPSKCHIQLQGPDRAFQVGEEAQIPLKSTCSCDFTLHYELASRGNIVKTGMQPASVTQQRSKRATVTFDKKKQTSQTPQSHRTKASASEVDVCSTYLHFTITQDMTPLSRLLVYYVRENGEGITDSIQLPVQPSYENKVAISISSNKTMPGDLVSVAVKGETRSCVCIAAVDKSMYLLKPGFQLTTEKIFQELADYDVSDAFGIPKEDGHFWWPGLSSRRRRRRRRRSSVFPWHWDITKDAHFAFSAKFGPRSRSEPSGEARLHLEIPDSITTWVTEAVGLSQESGLGLAKPTELRTFKPFFVDFTLPYVVIRGEQTKIPLIVYNYLPSCAEVHVKVTVPKGIKFIGHPGKRHLTRKMCISSEEAKPTSIVLSFSDLGLTNITAKAFAYSETSCCEGGLQALKNGKYLDDSYLEKRSPAGMDYVRRRVLVEPEGLPREYTYSIFFCPNEKIHISTPNKYEYQYIQKPARMTHFDVTVKAHNDAHLALSTGPRDTAEMVEIVIGGRQNARTWIAVSKMGEPVASASTPQILSWDEFRNFWVRWKTGLVQVGHGAVPSNESLIVEWAGARLPEISYIGFSTGWGSMGEFKIWRKEESDENHNEAFTLGVPHNVVPGSERATASMIGDVMGPTLNNLDNLLRLPFGCGEQNMIHFAPNVFVLKYLQKTKQLCSEVESEATDYLVQGYQRQLTYKREDGSYSAFGERDSSGSMWLTAFVLKSFAQSRGFIYIDPKELATAKDWIIRHQKEDGSFPAVGRILNKDIQGGIHGKISLTAYVVAALLETGITSEEEKAAVGKAKDFLETNTYSADDPYTTALSAYALTLLRSTHASAALRKLNNMAVTQDGFTHWSLTGTTVTDEDTFMGFNDGLSQSVVSAEVEMTAYALLTYTSLGDVASALPVVKWLSQQRNALGGFSSTQDTCVALQALSEYAILSYVGGVNLTISLASTNLDFQESFELNRANKKILQTAVIPSVPTGLFVSAKGEGCCLMQIDVAYNVPDPVAKPAFQLSVNLKEPNRKQYHHSGPARPPPRNNNRSQLSRRKRALDDDDDDPASDQDHQEYKVTVEACARWLHSGSSNMAVLEVPLLSGFRADVESLEQLLLGKQIELKRYEMDGRKILFYFDEIPSQCMTCVKFHAFREYIIGKTAPVPVKVYDYYEPAFEATRFYNVSETSPLARELCDGTTCNEVESSANQWIGFVHSAACKNVYDCLEEESYDQCTCYRDCGYDGDPVCGSDGVRYQNQCQMEVAACRNNTRIEQVPGSQCPSMETVTEQKEPVVLEEKLELTERNQSDDVTMPHLEVSYYSYGTSYEYDPDLFVSDVDDGFEMNDDQSEATSRGAEGEQMRGPVKSE